MVMMVSQEEGEVVVWPGHGNGDEGQKSRMDQEQQEQHTGTPKSSMMLRIWMGAQQARKSSSITSRAMLGHETHFQ